MRTKLSENAYYLLLLGMALLSGAPASVLNAQEPLKLEIIKVSHEQRVMVNIEGQPFTEFVYADSLEKPVLFPIYSPGGHIITRGFPRFPRKGESSDHPHHLGLWFNYENVNGLDFWNNSYAIPPEKKKEYGWIRTDSIVQIKSGDQGLIQFSAYWEDQQHHKLLLESTSFIFSADSHQRIIDRITKLTALTDLSFPDAKDGMLGLRVTRELQLPAAETRQFTDNKGISNSVKSDKDSSINGNYLSGEGKMGNEVWGTRSVWCLLFGKIDADTVSIVIIDHPKNPGYPTYWHARGYGLFAANPFGQKIFSNGKETLNYSLKKGDSVIFRYRIVIAEGKCRLSNSLINRLSSSFANSAE